MTINTTTTLEQIRENLRNTLKSGMLTNMGTFTHFDEQGYAHFDLGNGRKGVTGPLALHFVQVKKEK